MTAGRVDPAAAAAALGRPVVSAEIVRREPLAYDPFVGGRSVERVVGRAVAGGASTDAWVAWTAIVKRTRGGDLVAARRELWAYTQGIAGSSGPDMTAPALLGSEDGTEGVALWLEEVHDEHRGTWPLRRFAATAADIAAWDVAMRDTPAGGSLLEQAWAERHGQPHRVDEALQQLSVIRADPGPRLPPCRSATRASGARRR